jgi:predicted DNA-binding transcriptional regulator YafY
MARHDQIVRQWLLLRKLDSPRGATLAELVESVGDDYQRNPRTIRRDLEALGIAGFPLIDEKMNGQTRWKLADGFRDIPALGFSATELMALIFSRNLLRPLEGTELQASLASALNKATTALPPQGHEYVRVMEKMFSVGLGPHKSYRRHQKTIDLIAQAIDKKRTAQIRYFSASRNLTARREVDPYLLRYAAGGLYLVAYCHRRKDVRLFAVERIRSIALTSHPYQMPLGFDIGEYVKDALTVMRGKRVEAELVFSKRAAAWVRDRKWHESQELIPLKDGRLRMVLRVADTAELLGWILSFGAEVRVVSPVGLRQKVLDEARRIARG